MNRFDFIFFDSGGTLYSGQTSGNETPASVNAKKTERLYPLLRYYGYQGSMADLAMAAERSEEECTRKYGSYLFNHGDILLEINKSLGLNLSKEICYLLANVYSGPRYEEWLFKNTQEAIKSLYEANIKLGIIANTEWSGTSMDRAFEGIGLLKYFSYRVYSGDIRLQKPNLQIFQYAENLAQTKGKKVLYVGNDIDKDMIPAKKFGWWTAFRLPNKEAQRYSAADFQFDDINLLVKFCKGMP